MFIYGTLQLFLNTEEKKQEKAIRGRERERKNVLVIFLFLKVKEEAEPVIPCTDTKGMDW